MRIEEKSAVAVMWVAIAIIILIAGYYITYSPCKKYFPEEVLACVLSDKYKITEGSKQ